MTFRCQPCREKISLYRWVHIYKQYFAIHPAGRRPNKVRPKKEQYIDPELRALQEENARLKKIIGNQALELEFKTELLKKKRGLRAETQGLVKKYSLRSIPVRSLLNWAGLAASSFYLQAL